MMKNRASLDPRIRRTHKLLQQAFFELIAEKPFDAVSVQDIADRATVNRTTFYHHFIDKFALLEYWIGESFQERLQARTKGLADASPSCLKLLILATCDYLTEIQACSSHGGCRQFAPLVESKVKAIIRQMLLSGLQSGKTRNARTGGDQELAATMTSWAIFGAAHEWSRSGKKQSAEAYAERVLPLVKASLQMIQAAKPA